MTSAIQLVIGMLDVSLPFRHKSLRFSLIHQHIPRIALVPERPGAKRRQVQRLRHLPKLGGEVTVVDVSIIIRVELVEQSFDVSFRDVEFEAHRGKILVFDLPGLVHVAGGKQPPEVGFCSVHRIKIMQDVTLNSVPHESCSERRSNGRCPRASTETFIGPDPIVGGVRNDLGPN